MNDFGDAVPQELQEQIEKAADASADSVALLAMLFAQASLYEYNAWLAEKAKERNCPTFSGTELVAQFIDEEMSLQDLDDLV